ncbi:hypothetical protein Trydic_g9431 [Trypoxylus dichotomus]
MYMSAMTYGSGDSRAGNAPFWVFGGPPVDLCHRIKSVNSAANRRRRGEPEERIKTNNRPPPADVELFEYWACTWGVTKCRCIKKETIKLVYFKDT